MTVVIGTAGHIDHGKTSLLRALTGIDADRLPEEQRRGMTIDVGYAHLDLDDGSSLDFVDVPGHDRLIGNMLVGAGEIDAALLVVAADDGPRAQTVEHLELLDALGVHHGVVAITKIDAVDPARVSEVIAAVDGLIGRTRLAGAPVVPVSALRGDGLATLRDRLLELRAAVETDRASHPAPGGARLAIDRVFSVKGRGAVVTGTLRGATLARGATLRLVPGGATVRAREVQVHGAPVEALTGGGRVALNLAGVAASVLARGWVLTDDPTVHETDRLLVVVHRPADVHERATDPTVPAWPPPPGAILRLHLGTSSTGAAIRRGRRDTADLSDGRRVVTLRLDEPIAAAIGDAFVLRVPSPPATAAGGVVLDVAPPIGPSARRSSPEVLAELAETWATGDASRLATARVRFHGLLDLELGGGAEGTVSGARPVAGRWLVEPVAVALEDLAMASVRARHDTQPLAPGLPLAELRRTLGRALRRQVTTDERTADEVADGLLEGLILGARLLRAGDLVHDPTSSTGSLPPDVLAAMDRLEAILTVNAPPALADAVRATRCPVEGVRALEAAGRIVRVDDDLAWAATTYRDLEALALRLADDGPLTPAALRDASGTSRKYVMALLEDLVRRGVLRRTTEGHLRGPRAPR
jgi:selenocysteine-specific elongation factor